VLTVGGLQSGSWWGFGSSVLIAPRWVLLAGHQVAPNAYLGPYEAMRFNVRAAGTNTVVSRWYADAAFVHPEYTDTVGAGVDLALVHLTEAVTNITPAVLCRINPQHPIVMTMVGFGCSGVVEPPIAISDGVKRAVMAKLHPSPC